MREREDGRRRGPKQPETEPRLDEGGERLRASRADMEDLFRDIGQPRRPGGRAPASAPRRGDTRAS